MNTKQLIITIALVASTLFGFGQTKHKLVLPFGHITNITNVEYSPNGKFYLTIAEHDKFIIIWNAEDGKMIKYLNIPGEGYSINTVNWSSDGNRIIATQNDYVYILNVNTGELINEYGHENLISASISPNNNYLLTQNGDGCIVWNVNTKEILYYMYIPSYILTKAKWSPNGKSVLTIANDNTVKIWDIETGNILHTLIHKTEITSANWHGDNNEIITSSKDSVIRVWNIETQKTINRIRVSTDINYAIYLNADRLLYTSLSKVDTNKHSEYDEKYITNMYSLKYNKLLFTVDGIFKTFTFSNKHFITKTKDNYTDSTNVYNIETGELVLKVNNIFSISNKENALLTANNDHVCKWQLNSYKITNKFNYKLKRISFTKFSPDGKYIVIAFTDKTARIIEQKTGNIIFNFNYNEIEDDYIGTINILFSKNSKKIVVLTESCDTNLYNVYDTKTGKLLKNAIKNLSAEINNADTEKINKILNTAKITNKNNYKCSPKGTMVSIISKDTVNEKTLSNIQIWDIKTEKLLYIFEGDYALWVPDEEKIIINYSDELNNYKSKIINLKNGENICTYKGGIAKWSPNRKRILTYDGQLIDTKTGAILLRNIPTYFSGGDDIYFSNNENECITQTDNKPNYVINLITGDTTFVIESPSMIRHNSGYYAIITKSLWSPDDKYIVKYNSMGQVEIFDVNTGKRIHYIHNAHSRWIMSTAWYNNNELITFSDDNTIKFWDIKNGKLNRTINTQDCKYTDKFNNIILCNNENKIMLIDLITGREIIKHIPVDSINYINILFDKYFEGNKEALDQAHYIQGFNSSSLQEKLKEYYIENLWKKTIKNKLQYKNDSIKPVNVTTGKASPNLILPIGHSGKVKYTNICPNNKYAITISNDAIKIWKIKSGKLFKTIEGDFMSAKWSSNGKMITIEASDYLSVFNILTDKIYKVYFSFNDEYIDKERSIRWTLDNKKIIIYTSVDYGVYVDILEASQGYYLKSYHKNINYVNIAYDGSFFYGLTIENNMSFFDIETGEEISSIQLPKDIKGFDKYSFHISPDNKKILIKHPSKNEIMVFDIENSTKTSTIKLRNLFENISISPNGKTLLMYPSDYEGLEFVELFDVNSGKFMSEIDWNSEGYPMWLPDSNKVANIAYNDDINIYDISSGELLKTIIDSTGLEKYFLWEDNKKYDAIELNNTAVIFDFKRSEIVHKLIGHTKKIKNANWNTDKNIIFQSNDNIIKSWDVKTGYLLTNLPKKTSILTHLNISPNKKYKNSFSSRILNIFDIKSKGTICNIEVESNIKSVNWISDTVVNIQTINGTVQNWNILNNKLIKYIKLGSFIPIDVNIKDNKIVSIFNSQIKINDLNTGKEIIQLIAIDSTDYLTKTPDNYYMSTKNATKWLSFKLDNKLYGFEQFDLKYNRPDIVLSRLGYADSTLIEAYHKAYLKRLKKMGFKEEDLNGDFHIPESEIKNFEYLPVITDSTDIGLNLHFEDSKYKLDRINIWINDVAIYGINGINLNTSILFKPKRSREL